MGRCIWARCYFVFVRLRMGRGGAEICWCVVLMGVVMEMKGVVWKRSEVVVV